MITDKETWQEVWRDVCQLNDEECAGTRQCNYIACDNLDPLPLTLTQPEQPTSADEDLKTASGPGSIPIQRLEITQQEKKSEENRPHFLAPLVPPCSGMSPLSSAMGYDTNINSMVKCTTDLAVTPRKVETEEHPLVIHNRTDPTETNIHVDQSDLNNFVATGQSSIRRRTGRKNLRKVVITSHHDLMSSQSAEKSIKSKHRQGRTKCTTGACSLKTPIFSYQPSPCRIPCVTSSLFESKAFNHQKSSKPKRKRKRVIKWKNNKLKIAGAISF